MSRRSIFAFVGVALIGLAGWALAQQERPDPSRADTEGSRFAVSLDGDTAVLVETGTGKTWLLRHPADGLTSVWLPVVRVDNPQEADQWLARDRHMREETNRRADDSIQ